MEIYESRNKGINHTALRLESLDLEETDYKRERGRADTIKSALISFNIFNKKFFFNELHLCLCISLSTSWVYSIWQQCTNNYQNNMHCSLVASLHHSFPPSLSSPPPCSSVNNLKVLIISI